MPTPADLFCNLQYDPINMSDCTLAVEYINKCRDFRPSTIGDQPLMKEKKIKSDFYEYTINFCEINEVENSEDWLNSTVENKIAVLKNIANLIESSSILLAQLEQLLRDIPQTDVLKYDISILKRNINFYCDFSLIPDLDFYSNTVTVLFLRETPLFDFCDLVIRALSAGLTVVVVASQDIAIVADLFGKLCQKAGLSSDALYIYFAETDEDAVGGIIQNSIIGRKHTNQGCTIVVTESSDLDSAIDTLIFEATAAYVYPWKINRLLVQESIIVEFERRLNNTISTNVEKCKLISITKEENKIIEFLPKGAKVLTCYTERGPKFIVSGNTNYITGDVNHQLPIITLQAYRTTKELLCMLKKEPCYALSLWCDSVSIANEISTRANINFVWINSYGLFDHSIPFDRDILNFRNDDLKSADQADIKSALSTIINRLNSIKKIGASWKTQTTRERAFLILGVIKKFESKLESENTDHIDIKNITKAIIEAISTNAMASASIIGNKLQTCIVEPKGLVYVANLHCENEAETLTKSLLSLVHGNNIIYHNMNKDINELIIALNEAGVPILGKCGDIFNLLEATIYLVKIKPELFKNYNKIMPEFFQVCIDDYYSPYGIKDSIGRSLYNTKIIWSAIGETFAN